MAQWTPKEDVWAEAAYQEVVRAFPGKVKDRTLALCVHCLSRKPVMQVSQIEFLAQSDLLITGGSANDNKITESILAKAKKIMMHTAAKKKTTKKSAAAKLSRTEKALLSKFQATTKLFEEFLAAEDAVSTAELAFKTAREALRSISHVQAEVLADADPEAARVLQAAGVLRASAPEARTEPPRAAESPQRTQSPAVQRPPAVPSAADSAPDSTADSTVDDQPMTAGQPKPDSSVNPEKRSD